MYYSYRQLAGRLPVPVVTLLVGGGFALLALLVAGVGLYGVLSYTVAQRTREIGVRMALGARQVDVVRLVIRQGYAVTAAGLVVGLLGSLAATRTIEALVVPLILLLVATAACVGPARRAARLDPVRALRG